MCDGVMVLDAKGRVIDANYKMKTILSTNLQGKFIGKKFYTVLPNDQKLRHLLIKHESGKLELKYKIDDQDRCFEVDVTQLEESTEAYSGTIIIFRDITERRKSEEKLNEQSNELLRVNQLKDRLFSIIGHDLRGPMMNLKLLMNMIDKEMVTVEEFKVFLPELSKKLNYTSSLLENLLYWSRSQLQGQHINCVQFDLKEVADKEIVYFKQKAREKGISIRDNVADGTKVFADIDMIELVIRNVLTNAIKFCCKDDEIIIWSQRNNGNGVTMCIEDTGTGMSKDKLKKLFGAVPFTTKGTNNEQGTGLGLQLCKEFIEKNHGKIWAESEEGKGTSIFFSLPAAVPAIAEQEAEAL